MIMLRVSYDKSLVEQVLVSKCDMNPPENFSDVKKEIENEIEYVLDGDTEIKKDLEKLNEI